MLAVIAEHGPARPSARSTDALRREETTRGLTFEYCLITAGSSHNRAPSDQRWERGDVLSLDSGGNYHGYIGDLCAHGDRSASPMPSSMDLLAEIEAIQRAAFEADRSGRRWAARSTPPPSRWCEQSNQHNHMHFLAHGMGLVSHEAPRLTAAGRCRMTPTTRSRPLEAGMVISVETTLLHPRRGFIKLEDTVAVTPTGTRFTARAPAAGIAPAPDGTPRSLQRVSRSWCNPDALQALRVVSGRPLGRSVTLGPS